MSCGPLFRNIIPASRGIYVMELIERAGVMVTLAAFGPSGEGYVRLALVIQDEEMLNKAKSCQRKAAS